MSRIDVDGLGVNVRRLGLPPDEAPTVVMLHGLSADNLSSLYYTLAPPAARVAHVVLYDLRGHGRTDRPDTGYGLDDSVADLDGVLRALDLVDPVHIVGHSYGGAVAVSYALARPDRVASIAMVEGHVARPGWGAYMADCIAFLAFGMAKPEVQEWMHNAAGRKARQAMIDVEALIEDTSWVDDIASRTTTVTDDDLRSLRLPVLGIYGEHSDVLETGHAVRDLVPGSRFELIPGHNHSLLLPCVDRLNELLVPWLIECAAGAAPEAVPSEAVAS